MIKKIFSFFLRSAGRAHDTKVWQRSPLHNLFSDHCHMDDRTLEDSYHILGDSAYPLSNYLITPYHVRGGRLDAEKKKLNTHLVSLRSVVESAFTLLVLRFPRLLKLMCKNVNKWIIIVVAACLFHNWCLMEDDEVI